MSGAFPPEDDNLPVQGIAVGLSNAERCTSAVKMQAIALLALDVVGIDDVESAYSHETVLG